MKKRIIVLLLVMGASLISWTYLKISTNEDHILSYIVNPQEQNIQFFLKDSADINYANFANLKMSLNKSNHKLIFAMNGGMYKSDLSPLGLYIENGKMLNPLDTIENAFGNFYMQPNGVFYITNDNKPKIVKTTDFIHNDEVKYATQSGPMLIIDGVIHKKFMKGSQNLNIRNGVGILPNGDLLFAMSKEEINFYDFATFFKQQGCNNALYLDGSISRTYLPKKNWIQMDGNFGVIIAEVQDS